MTLDQDDIDAIVAAVTAPLTALLVTNSGVGGSATTNTFRLQNDASSTDNIYVGQWVRITSVVVGSPVGVGQVRLITAYNGTTKDATVYPPWTATPSSASYVYRVYPTAWVGGAVNAATGARVVTITVNDGSTALQGALVRVTQGAESYTASTASDGTVAFSLNDATWTVSITKPGYTFTPVTLVVAGNVTHTYSMTAVTVTPSSGAETTGYLTVLDSTGAIEGSVSVTLQIIAIPADTGIAYDTTLRTAASNGAGLVQWTGIPAGVTVRARRGTYGLYSDTVISATPDPTTQLNSLAGKP